MEPSLLISFAAAVVALNVVPGPGMMFLIAHGAGGGRRAGLLAALGMASGTVVHTAAAVLGLGALLRAAPYALDVVRVIGAAVLLYLAFEALRTAKAPVAVAHSTAHRAGLQTYATAVLTNLANPKVVLFYIAFVPQFLTPHGWAVQEQTLILGAILIVIGLVMDCAIGLAAASLSTLLLRRPGVQRWLKRASAAIFGGLAARLLSEGH